MDTTTNYRNLFSGPAIGSPYEPPKAPDFRNMALEPSGEQSNSDGEGNTAEDAVSEEAGQTKAKPSEGLSPVVREFLTALQEMGVEAILGTDGNDEISGWAKNAVIAGDGDDLIKVWSDSAVDAGAGNDTIHAWSGSAVDAGEGADTVYAWSDSNVSGGGGNDRIDAWSNSTVTGEEGDDEIHAWSESRVSGGAGNDRIDIWSGSYADGGDGNDVINAHSDTEVDGGSGDDVIDAHSNSKVSGGDGNDTIRIDTESRADGGSGNDYIFAGTGSIVSGGAGDDRIHILGEGTVHFNAGDGYDQMKMGMGGTIRIGPNLSAADMKVAVEGNIATVKFGESADWFEVQLTPAHPVNVVFEDGTTFTLEPDDDFTAAFEAAKTEMKEKLRNGELVALKDYSILAV